MAGKLTSTASKWHGNRTVLDSIAADNDSMSLKGSGDLYISTDFSNNGKPAIIVRKKKS